MTTEEAAFQAALNVNPDDHVTRAVLADYLEECGDPRSSGYRCLAALRKRPHMCEAGCCYHNGKGGCGGVDLPQEQALPEDWFLLVGDVDRSNYTRFGLIRKEVEDAAAIAFLELPTERQAELLATEVLV